MRLLTAEQSLKIDQLMQSHKNLSAEKLMREASKLCAEKFLNLTRVNRSDAVLIVCGPGNNGGDGLCIAKLLLEHTHVEILQLDSAHKSSLNQQMRDELLKQINPRSIHNSTEVFKKKYTHIIDALFGVGLNRNLEKNYIEVIKCINKSKSKIWSIDVPSGLNCDSGSMMPVAVRAHHTFTISRPKPGFFLRSGVGLRGRLHIIPLFTDELLSVNANTHFLFTRRHAQKYFKTRRPDANKSSFGRSAIVAGSKGMWGAARLSAEASFRMGSGYVCWFPFEKNKSILEPLPEVMIKSLETENFHDYSWLMGPGLSADEKLKDLIIELINKKNSSVVLDAGALTTLQKYKITSLPESWIITPHSGELSRLIDKSSDEINASPIEAALLAQKKLGCIVLLKGLYPVVVTKEKVIIVHSGNMSLAKAGTGDVLSGFIVALLAQGYKPLRALLLATFIHGYIADEWVKNGNDPSSFMASDLLKLLPQTLVSIRKKLK